jgi:predicted nucleic acid-binding protein
MYLVDTNVWLERLLNQDKSDEVGRFLSQVSARDLSVTDFTFHSICVILTRLAKNEVLLDFVQDVFIDATVKLVSLTPDETRAVIDTIDMYKLDFDDAYQYVAAERNELTLISFDSDFDKTDKGKKTPADVLRENEPGDAE